VIKALIVDDVSLAREAIRIRLKDENDIEIVGEASSGPEAVSAVRRLAPDLVFLDIKMPELDAFQVLEAIPTDRSPSVIFVTAHDKYAVAAFRAHALHYLLKPIDDDQFSEALQRARRELESEETRRDASHQVAAFLASRARESDSAPNRKLDPAPLTRFAVKDRDGFILVRVEDVDWIESAGNYAELHVQKRRFLVRMILSELEERLAGSFARISRSTIVNISRVQRVRTLWHGDYQVVLADGTALRMSRRYRKRLIP
jgi:two-component system, LytTR family, response regulator